MVNGRVLAVVDASVDKRCMTASWIVTTNECKPRCYYTIKNNMQMSGQTLVAEGIGVLNLIKEINSKTSHLQHNEIVIYSDMRKIVNESQIEITKESQCTRKASTTVKATKDKIRKAKITIKLECSSTNIRADHAF